VDDIVVVPIDDNGAGFSALPGFKSIVQIQAAVYLPPIFFIFFYFFAIAIFIYL
jgi:hypothetical protein